MPTPEGQAWLDRWKLMNALEVQELRAATADVGLEQLESLYASIDFFGWREAMREGESEVRAKWIRLKEKYGPGT